MTSQPTDEELEQFMSEESSLSRRYRDSQSKEPPAKLNSKILEAAKAELEANKSRTTMPLRRPVWALPVSIAAIMVLSVSVVITMQQQPTQLTDMDEAETRSAGDTAGERKAMTEPVTERSSLKSISKPQVAPQSNEAGSIMAEEEATLPHIRLRESDDMFDYSAADRTTKKQESKADMDIAAPAAMKKAVPAPMPMKQAEQSSAPAMDEKEAQLVATLQAAISQDDLDTARAVLRRFRDNNPDYTDTAMQELIGLEWYRLLQSR